MPPRLVHVPSGNRLRLVDLAARTVTTVFEAPEPIVSVAVPGLGSRGNDVARKRPILVRTGSKVDRLDHKYQVASAFVIPAGIDPGSTLEWYELDDGRAVAQFILNRYEKVYHRDITYSSAYLVATDGTIAGSYELALRNGVIPVDDRAGFALTALALPFPAGLAGFVTFNAAEAAALQGYPPALGRLIREAWPAMAATVALAAVLAVLAWRRARAYGLSGREQAVWAGLVLLFGLPAWVGFLLSRSWPARQPCPRCRARVPRDRDACTGCGAPSW